MKGEKTPLNPGKDIGSGTFAPKSQQNATEGLTSEEAAELLLELGPNKLDAVGKESFLSILLVQCKNVIFLLTTVAATICYFTGEDVKASVLLGIVFCVCLTNAIGEYSGQDAGAALAGMQAKQALVLRNGEKVPVPAEDLVDGDVVFIQIGDVVPADMLVLEAEDILVDEGLLTGESMEVAKTVVPKTNTETAFPSNIMYKDTNVVSGRGKGIVQATGMRTQVGLIAKRLDKLPPALNPLQKSINRLGGFIGMACAVMLVVAFLISYSTKYQNPMSPCPDDDDQCFLLGSIVRGLLMAVSLIPHGLPLVVMVMLRVGAQEMAKINACVTKKTAVDYLGAATVICTDKTGTLTEGKMAAQTLVGFARQPAAKQGAEIRVSFYPMRGLSPNGGVFAEGALSAAARSTMDAKFDLKKVRQTYSVPGLIDLGAPLEPGQSPAGAEGSITKAHLACAFLSTHNSTMSQDAENGAWTVTGNMTDAALKVAAAKGNLWDGRVLGLSFSP